MSVSLAYSLALAARPPLSVTYSSTAAAVAACGAM